MHIYSDYLITNKYSKWYLNIIENARNRILEDTVYTEIHHIIPVSFGGSNSKSNLVILTYREHFICHWLLCKCAVAKYKRKAFSALSAMRRRKNQVILPKSSWIFEVMKCAAKEAMVGRVVNEETRAKNRAIAIALRQDPEYIEKWNMGMANRNIGPRTESQTRAARKSILKYNGSERHIAAIKKAQSGIPKSQEQRNKQSETMKNGAAAFGDKNAMKDPVHVEKVRKAKIGLKALKKAGHPRKMVKPDTDKWNSLIAEGYSPK